MSDLCQKCLILRKSSKQRVFSVFSSAGTRELPFKMRSECVDEAKDDGYDPDRLREVRADLASDGKAWSAAGRQG